MGRYFKNEINNQTCILILESQKNSKISKTFRITNNLKYFIK